MSVWIISAVKWGGICLTVLCAAALLHAAFIAPAGSKVPIVLYWMLLVIGLAFTFAGFRWERQKSSNGG